jgi:hypothetical protein
MAESGSGGIGVLGVLVGALLVIVVGGGLLFATGILGSGGGNKAAVTIEAPKLPSPPKTTGSGS